MRVQFDVGAKYAVPKREHGTEVFAQIARVAGVVHQVCGRGDEEKESGPLGVLAPYRYLHDHLMVIVAVGNFVVAHALAP